MLLFTSILLFITRYFIKGLGEVTFGKSLFIGLAQSIAILPGISRSGSTIAMALVLGVSREKAAKFSFLMVVPLIFGKVVKDILAGDIVSESFSFGPLFLGFIAAFFTGLFACKWMISLVRSSKLKYFSFYCFTVAVLVIIWKII